MRRYIKHLTKGWQHHGITQASTFTVLAGVFLIISLSLLINQNFKHMLQQWGQSLQVSVYLEDQITEKNLSRIKNLLNKSDYFEDIQYTSKDDALQRFKGQISIDIANLSNNLDNPLPASFEMRFAENIDPQIIHENISTFFLNLGDREDVESVVYGQDWVEDYASFLKFFTYASLLLIAFLLFGSLFVIGNSIRSSISNRQKEIEILELVGATSSFIRRPYIVDGLLTGLFSSALSLLICYFLFYQISYLWQEKMGLWDIQPFFLNLQMISIILLMGLLTGFFGSWLCVSRINSGWLAAQEGYSNR